jgi:hypothetical protein
MVWTAILGRMLDRPVINLGFNMVRWIRGYRIAIEIVDDLLTLLCGQEP